MTETVECPECGREFGQGTPFNTHWGAMHDGPTPDSVDTTRDSDIGKKVSETMKGRGISQGEDNPNYGGMSEEHQENLSESLSGRELSEEHKDSISEGLQKHYEENEHHNLNGNISEEHRRSIVQGTQGINQGEDNGMHGRTGKEHPNYGVSWPEEMKERISKTKVENDDGIGLNHYGFYSEELGFHVRSSWEEEIGLLLKKFNLDFEYESEGFEIDSGLYLPDFFVGRNIIEVKGWDNDKSRKQAREFMEEYGSEYTYIVVGKEIPADIHIPWEEREELIEVI